MVTLIGAEMYSPTLVESPPVVNAVTGGSPPTNRKTCSGSLLPPAHGLDPSLMDWVTFIPAAISCVHGGPTTPFRVAGPLSVRVYPSQVVGMAVPDGNGGGTAATQPVVPGVCVPGVALSETPQPKPTPVPSQVRKVLAAPALGVP